MIAKGKSSGAAGKLRGFGSLAGYVSNAEKMDAIAEGWGNLAAYVADDHADGHKMDGAGRGIRLTNFEPGVTTLDQAIKDVSDVQSVAQRGNGGAPQENVYHLIVSFPPGERPTVEQLAEMEDTLVASIGLQDHQRLSAIHTNTDCLHLHVAINKIHPETFGLASMSHDRPKLMAACKELEIKYSLEQTHADRAVMPDGTEIKGGAKNFESKTGQMSLQRWAQENAAADLLAAGSWDDLHSAAAKHGLFIKKQGAGLVLGTIDNPNLRVKASTVSRDLSIKKLQDRLGAFEAGPTPQEQTEGADGYDKPPVKPEQRESPLWDEFQKLKAEAPAKRKAALDAIRERHKDYRKAMRNIGAKARLEESKAQAATERKEAYERTRAPNWHDFLCGEVAKGNEAALALLRSVERRRAAFATNVLRTPDLSAGKTVVLQDAKKSVGRDGSIRYFAKDGGTVTDTGREVGVGTVTQGAATLALALAAEKHDRPLQVKGTDEFKDALARAAAMNGTAIQFADPDMQARHAAAIEERKAWLERMERGPTLLAVPFEDREKVKALGAVWDKGSKKWAVPAGEDAEEAGLGDWIAETSGRAVEPVYLVVPAGEKDAAKAAGARWESDVGRWYIPEGVKTEPFAAWIKGKTSRADMDADRHELLIPFGHSDAAKASGAEWDKAAKAWFAPAGCTPADIGMELYTEGAGLFSKERTYLNVPFGDRDEVKALGGKFDAKERMWFVPPLTHIPAFKKWDNLAETRADAAALDEYVGHEKCTIIDRQIKEAKRGTFDGVVSLNERVSLARFADPDGTNFVVRITPENAAAIASLRQGDTADLSGDGTVTVAPGHTAQEKPEKTNTRRRR